MLTHVLHDYDPVAIDYINNLYIDLITNVMIVSLLILTLNVVQIATEKGQKVEIPCMVLHFNTTKFGCKFCLTFQSLK